MKFGKHIHINYFSYINHNSQNRPEGEEHKLVVFCFVVVDFMIFSPVTTNRTIYQLLLTMLEPVLQVADLVYSIFTGLLLRKSSSIVCVCVCEREREMFYLTTHSTHFINGYMA